MLAPSRPTAIAGVILNDIGPLIELPGIVRIKGYVGKLPTPRTFKEGAEILRWWFDAQFPKLAPQDWLAFAQRTWREHRGGLVPDYDLKLARTLKKANLERLPTLWNQFDALARVPLMVIRGANSDMLALTTGCNAGAARRARSCRSTGSRSRAVAGRAQADTADCSLCRIVRRSTLENWRSNSATK